jgi:hypothetical protein
MNYEGDQIPCLNSITIPGIKSILTLAIPSGC